MKRAVSSLSLLITKNDQTPWESDRWTVWLENLAESSTRSKVLLVGRGKTRDEAVQRAVTDLEAAIEQLQGPPGVIEELI